MVFLTLHKPYMCFSINVLKILIYKFIQFNNHSIPCWLTVHSCAVLCKRKRKKILPNQNMKKKLQKSKLFLALTKQTVFKCYKVSSSHFNSLRKDPKFWYIPLPCCWQHFAATPAVSMDSTFTQSTYCSVSKRSECLLWSLHHYHCWCCGSCGSTL